MRKTLLLLFISFLITYTAKSQSVEMVDVEGGTFFMGNDFSDEPDERPEHKVTIKSFQISKYEVTFDEFDKFCEATGIPKPDDGGFGRKKLPVTNVSWYNAIMFCNWISQRDGFEKCYDIKRDSILGFRVSVDFTKNGYRLPTEAEWEYAARGGKVSKNYSYSGSDNADDICWHKGNSGSKPSEIGKKQPNELGIYDMTGNTWEWCWDYYGKEYYKSSPEADPTGPERGNERVYRGGGWNSPLDYLRLSRRYRFVADKNYGLIGIRLAKSK